MNGFVRLTVNAKNILKYALNLSIEKNGGNVNAIYILKGILESPQSLAFKVLSSAGFVEKLRPIVDKYILEHEEGHVDIIDNVEKKETELSSEFKDILELSYIYAKNESHVFVGSEHILLSIFSLKSIAEKSKLNESDVRQALLPVLKEGLTVDNLEKTLNKIANYPLGILFKPESGDEMRNELLPAIPSILPLFGRNLTLLAKKGQLSKIYGREKEINRLIGILERRSKNNAILTGDSGVGKTAIVEALANRIATGYQLPDNMLDMEIWQIDVPRLLSQGEMKADLETKILAIIHEAEIKGNIIFFIDEIHMIFSGGFGMPNQDIASILKPFLLREDLRFIGATTSNEYQKFIENDAALARRFQNIRVDEIQKEDALMILNNSKHDFENYHGILIDDNAIEVCVDLASKYLSDRFLPDSAIDLLDEACANIKTQITKSPEELREAKLKLAEVSEKKDKLVDEFNFSEAKKMREIEEGLLVFIEHTIKTLKRTRKATRLKVNEESIRQVVSRWTGIPVESLTNDEINSLKTLDVSMKMKIIGQSDAIHRVAQQIKSAKLGLKSPNKPLASLMFLGPTGVGKTETAKVLSDLLFGSRDRLVQIDMSEYMESYSVSKLIGSPPGYIGYTEGGQLTEKIRRHPYSVVLFDEIEKAHPDVLNILLQILEEGRLTDSKGRVANFKNTVVILTSNIGARNIIDDSILGFNIPKPEDTIEKESYDDMRNSCMQEMKDVLPPELINRIDDIIIYRGLNEKDIKTIAKNAVNELLSRLSANGITLSINNKVINLVASQGFSKEFGARPIHRSINENIEFPLSDFLLSDIKNMKKKITANVEKGKVVFNV